MTTANGTALAVVQPAPIAPSSASTQLEPSTAEQAFWLATQLVKSGLLGRSVSRPESAFAIILAGRELGLTTMQSLRSIHIIEGKPTLSSDLMVALVKRSPICKFFKLVESTELIATYETDRVGEGVTRMSFTWEDAKRANVTNKNNWKQYPAAMLRARCIAALARAVYPDLLMGIYEDDEISSASMPAVSESNVAYQPPEPEPAEPDASLVETWASRFATASSLADVDTIAAQCKAAVTDMPTLLAISVHVDEAKSRLKPQTEKESSNG